MTANDNMINSMNKKIAEIHYKITRKLGEGMFSTVKLATHSLTGEQVAIKILEKTRITKIEDKERINREIAILKKLHHFNISKLYQVVENKLTIYLVQEYIQGKELLEYLTKKGKLKEVEACKFYHQIISGLEYIHQCGISHRDFKPENILLTNNNTILKIIDFGLSNIIEGNQLLKTACGSPCYVPPEMIKEEKYDGALTDIWSSGIILYLMLCGKLPFFHEENEVMYEQILSGKFELPDFLSDNAKDLLSKLLEIDPQKRIKFEQIKAHPWFATINKKNFVHKGININEDIIPIDEEIIQKMEKIGFNKMEIRYNVLKNFHNKITTVYDLFLKQKIENGKKSVADLNSDLYDEYIKDEKNKIKYYGSFEDALKSRISDGDEKLDTLPNYDEDKYNNENENIIVGDSGSVIERLIKRGKFTYDEENMCINKVSNINTRKENKSEIINNNNDDDGDSKFKTISQMHNKPKKAEKKIEEISKEIFDVKNNFVKKEKTKSPELSLKKGKIKTLGKNVKVELKICDGESDSEKKAEKVKKKKKVENNDNDWYNEIEAMILRDSQAIPKLKKSSSVDQRKKKDEPKHNASIHADKAKENGIVFSTREIKNPKTTKKIRSDHNNKNDNKKKTKITNNNNKKEKTKTTAKLNEKQIFLSPKHTNKRTLIKKGFHKSLGMDEFNDYFQYNTTINNHHLLQSTRTVKVAKKIKKFIATENNERKEKNEKIEKKEKKIEKITKNTKNVKNVKNVKNEKKIGKINNTIKKFQAETVNNIEELNGPRKRGASCARRTNKLKI